MRSILAIPLQKLFLITLILKVVSSGIGWKIGDPWIFGFAIPIFFMAGYIALGLNRSSYQVPDDKFADSCYYLGFIFTITSIIFSLFDLPNIATKMSDIAVRFGAAMVSTVLGLSVRIYLVSFKKDVGDAMDQSNTGVIEAADKLREHFIIAYEKLRDFESRVDESTKDSIAKVGVHLEAMMESYGDKLADFFDDLTEENRVASDAALIEVKNASNRLSESVGEYATSLGASLKLLEDKVTWFSTAMTDRLSTTTFPDDYFSKKLAEPISNLRNSTTDISTSVAAVAQEVRTSNAVLISALKSMHTKATSVETSLDRVTELADTQARIVASADSQLRTFTEISMVMTQMEDSLSGVKIKLGEQDVKSDTLVAHVAKITESNAKMLQSAAATQINVAHVSEQIPRIMAVFENLGQQLTSLTNGIGDQTNKTNTLNEHLRITQRDSAQTLEFAAATQTAVKSAAEQLPLVMESVEKMAAAIASFSVTIKQLQVKVEILPSKNVKLFTDDFGQEVRHQTNDSFAGNAGAHAKVLFVDEA